MLCCSITLDFYGGNLIRQRWPIQIWDVISRLLEVSNAAFYTRIDVACKRLGYAI